MIVRIKHTYMAGNQYGRWLFVTYVYANNRAAGTYRYSRV